MPNKYPSQKLHNIKSVCTVDQLSLSVFTRICRIKNTASRLPNPTPFVKGGGGRICPMLRPAKQRVFSRLRRRVCQHNFAYVVRSKYIHLFICLAVMLAVQGRCKFGALNRNRIHTLSMLGSCKEYAFQGVNIF